MLAENAAAILGAPIELHFLSSEKLPDGAKVLPLLLGEGWHARNDIVRLGEASACSMLPPLSSHAVPIACMAGDLAKEALAGKAHAGGSAIFAVYHHKGFEPVAAALRGLSARFENIEVIEIYGDPDISRTLQDWQQREFDSIVVQPLALFEGRTMTHVRKVVAESSVAASVGPVLSSHAAFAGFIADCFRDGGADSDAA